MLLQIVFYSCPHFGSKLADMPWRIGLVLRPAPSMDENHQRPKPKIGELRSGSPRLVELNDFIRQLHKKGLVEVLTKVTSIVEGYGGWAWRMEIVPIESAYPGFGELVVRVTWKLFFHLPPSLYLLRWWMCLLDSITSGRVGVLESTDHINSCKPVCRADPSYTETLKFLQKLKTRYS
uniref:Uncharacterized protein n=1 Tax=Populus alba TaxID=43335 RepID=A0A4U5PYL6_POPAL|nr:hypothetical protein D5086_0000173000 [Populus alba]